MIKLKEIYNIIQEQDLAVLGNNPYHLGGGNASHVEIKMSPEKYKSIFNAHLSELQNLVQKALNRKDATLGAVAYKFEGGFFYITIPIQLPKTSFFEGKANLFAEGISVEDNISQFMHFRAKTNKDTKALEGKTFQFDVKGIKWKMI